MSMTRDYVFLGILFGMILAAVILFSGGGVVPNDTGGIDPGSSVRAFAPADTQKQEPDQQPQSQPYLAFREELRSQMRMVSDILDQRKGDLPDMIEKREIRVLTTFTLGNYFVHKGQEYGYEYSKMEEFRKFLNQDRGRRELQVEFYYIPLPFDVLIEALNDGYGDIVAANLTITPEREAQVAFSDPYLWGIKEVLVSHKDAGDIKSREDLAGRRIHVRENSSYHGSLLRLNQDLTARKLDPVRIELLPGLLGTGEIIQMVGSGAVQLTVADNHLAEITAELVENIRIHDHITFNEDVRFGWMVRKDNPELKASLDRFVKTVKKGTLIGNIFFKRYFKDNPWAREYVQKSDLEELTQYAPLFQKYGEMYDIDWILIAAQSFQESRFDPNARSRRGAQGLMQLLPSTAKDMGIEDISTPENNVHAGVKYLRWIEDRYFPEGDISDDDRIRFALAAYNAGPANIRRSRTSTSQLGYDSNRWFNHTELGTMQSVGLEPVHYVRNINKYYLSFRMSLALSELRKDIR
ncbi:MAG: transglycosylase SLT domain-containing protein [Candidatus Aminicenantaceae bacterium]